MTVEQRRAYIARFDSRSSYLLGIWSKASSNLVGCWSIYVDTQRSAFVLNVLIGSPDDREQSALKETRDLLYPYFFDEVGLENVECSVTARNEKMIAFLTRQRWTHEGTVRKASATGAGTAEVLRFRLTREAWRARCADEQAGCSRPETETGPAKGP